MTNLFIDTLNRVAFNWFRKLRARSIKSSVDLETPFLSHFYEDEAEVIIPNSWLRNKEMNSYTDQEI